MTRRRRTSALSVALLLGLAAPAPATAELPPPRPGTNVPSLGVVPTVGGESLVELGRKDVAGFGTLTLFGKPPGECTSSPYLLALSGERVSYVEIGRCEYMSGRDQSVRVTLALKQARAVVRGARKYLWIEFVKTAATQESTAPEWDEHPQFLLGWVFDVTTNGTLRRLVEQIPVIAYVNKGGKPSQIDVDFDAAGNMSVTKRTHYLTSAQSGWIGTTRVGGD
jgi:hypothetical protein